MNTAKPIRSIDPNNDHAQPLIVIEREQAAIYDLMERKHYAEAGKRFYVMSKAVAKLGAHISEKIIEERAR